jgi:general secretion pathway protein H
MAQQVKLVAKELMQKLVIGMPERKTLGFTLLELLVVLVIIGITISFGLMALGDFGEKRRTITIAEQFINTIHTLQQQAILENSNLGIKLNNTEYNILRLNITNNTWEKNTQKNLLQQVNFPKSIHATSQNNSKLPDVMINSLGEISAFKIYFRTQHNNIIITHNQGEIIMQVGT